ncbi:unnamed protein product [Durusdinium trenchii]|uniref:Very-long-chain (3R)-3-hydroxyacyl-CoA dehydratase n=1 Tax=Durusdinium trenchii TaxID=1381693 RepID=A0ABP0L849_9DINO
MALAATLHVAAGQRGVGRSGVVCVERCEALRGVNVAAWLSWCLLLLHALLPHRDAGLRDGNAKMLFLALQALMALEVCAITFSRKCSVGNFLQTGLGVFICLFRVSTALLVVPLLENEWLQKALLAGWALSDTVRYAALVGKGVASLQRLRRAASTVLFPLVALAELGAQMCVTLLGVPVGSFLFQQMGKGGKGKGKTTKVWTEPKKWESKGKGKASEGRWIWVEDEPYRPKGKGKGKGGKGGKAKGKGKRRAAPLKSEFWNKKVEAEGRKEMGDTVLPGVIQRYSFKQGWGFIKPDNLASLPGQVKKKVNEAEAAAEAEGKEVKERGLLYFRKPDVNHEEGFKLTEGTSVTFRVYIDSLGAGALDVSMA